MNKTKKVKVKKTRRKWSNKYKKVLTVITPKDFHKNNIVNMEENKRFMFSI